MRKTNLKTLFSAGMLGLLMCANINTMHAKKKAAYLFTYFTGNAPQEEQIRYAISYDGFNYTPLNDGNPIVSSDTISLKRRRIFLYGCNRYARQRRLEF